MANVFDDVSKVRNSVKRNNFDWSHANNLTTDIGRITPIFAELLPANSSVRIKPRLGMQFMPMVFPIQTRMKARVAFFKYPLRALWKDYRDYVGNFRAGLVEPYHNFNNVGHPKTGSLYDYLGLPTTQIGVYGSSAKFSSRTWNHFCIGSNNTLKEIADLVYESGGNGSYLEYFTEPTITKDASSKSTNYALQEIGFGDVNAAVTSIKVTGAKGVQMYAVFEGSDRKYYGTSVNAPYQLNFTSSTDPLTLDVPEMPAGVTLSSVLMMSSVNTLPLMGFQYNTTSRMFSFAGANQTNLVVTLGYESSQNVIDLSVENSPYRQLHISAYKARAYEGIYNAYFRDIRNNPFYIGSEVQYNQWLPTMDGGSDSTLYELHYANWEKDAYTTAVQSPQQGVAPLVGLTTYTESYTNEDGSVTTKNGVALVDEDGRAFGVDFTNDDEGLTDVKYTELDPNSAVVNQPRSLIDVVQSGISINDLRNVNAYQKYLELNMRAGYSYRNIVQARFNVKVRYDELLMPEFVGGFTRDIDMRSITQTVQRADNGLYADALGSQSGIAGVRESEPPTISVFCDEESIVLGVLTITPIPVYTQILPKDFLYNELLDHYQPEFNNIGFQPIMYTELCPVQAFMARSSDSDTTWQSQTFGYQRPWHEYVQKLDVAHGLFRTSMRNWIMNRTFNEAPKLNEAFLLVDPSQVNDVFAVTETTDKIYGQIWFDCVAKLPISRRAIPRLD